MAQMVKNLPAIQSLAWEDPLEKEMTTHSSILAWRIPWTEEPGVLQFMGFQSLTRLTHQTKGALSQALPLRMEGKLFFLLYSF